MKGSFAEDLDGVASELEVLAGEISAEYQKLAEKLEECQEIRVTISDILTDFEDIIQGLDDDEYEALVEEHPWIDTVGEQGGEDE